MENFYLESNEEFFSIIDRIKRSRDENITLAVPSGLSALRSIINLRILKEEAISSGKNISIITSDSLIKKLAQQANIVVLEKPFEDAEQVGETEEKPEKPSFVSTKPETTEDKDWPEQLKEGGEIRPRAETEPKRRIISDIVKPSEPVEPIPIDRGEPIREPKPFFEPIEEEEEEIVEEPVEEPVFVEEKEEAVYEPKRIKPSFKFFTKKRLIATLVILVLIAGGFILYFVLPRTQIIIDPKKEAIRFETEIRVDKNIDSVNFSDNSVPGQVFQLEMEDSRKFPTTGEKEVEEKARGTIIVYNQYSSEPQTLVKTTRFLSERGKLFRLVETVVIPGATIEEGEIIPSNKEVEVIADEAGESYNIDPSAFTIPGFEGTAKYDAFYGQSTESMTGGAKGKMRVATEEDVEGGIEIVSVELKSKVQEQFRKKIPSDLKLLKDTQTLEVTESDSTLEADEPGKEFLVTVKAKAWALAFKEDDVFYLIEKNIGDKISENKILIPSTIQISYSNIETDLAGGRADFSCQVEVEAAWRLDEEKFRNDLAGKDEIEVRKYLSSLSEIEGAKVIFWPFWVKRIPRNKDKIKIIIETE